MRDGWDAEESAATRTYERGRSGKTLERCMVLRYGLLAIEVMLGHCEIGQRLLDVGAEYHSAP